MTLSLTHLTGPTRDAQDKLKRLFANTFGINRAFLDVSISKQKGVGTLPSDSSNSTDAGKISSRRLDAVDFGAQPGNANMYKFYAANVAVTCSASTSCSNVSATMGHIRDA